MKHTTSTLLLFTTLMIATSCGGGSSTGSPATGSTSGVQAETPKVDDGPGKVIGKNGVTFTERRSVELNADFSNIEEVKKNLNTFIVRAEFERPLEGTSYLRCPKIVGGNEVTPTVTMSEGTTAREIKIELNDNDLQIDVNCQIIADRKEMSYAKYSFKKSLIIEKDNQKLKSLSIGETNSELQLDRLIINEGTLLVEDKNAVLNVEDAYFNKGVIGTYSDDQLKPNPLENLPGHNGGSLKINAKNSYGSFVAHMVGTIGNEQLEIPAAAIFTGIMQDPAKDSVTSPEYNPCERSIPILIKSSLPPTTGGPGSSCRPIRSYCQKHALDGDKGAPGVDGYPGNPGGKSGKLQYTTENASKDFEIKFEIQGGDGGAGGQAGQGSEGNNGGRASERCNAGAHGEHGASGQPGLKGATGEAEVSCYEIKSAKIITCSKQ